MIKTGYKRRLFINFFVLFTIFTVSILFFEYTKNKRYKTEALIDKLDTYASIIYKSIINAGSDSLDIQPDIVEVLPRNLRISVIDNKGVVLIDNLPNAVEKCHFNRKEIIEAKKTGAGFDIRKSLYNDTKYLYYAKQFPRFFIRVALPYNLELKNSLAIDKIFLYFIILLFLFILFLSYLLTNRFGESIKKLRDFALNPTNKLAANNLLDFPNDELGEVAQHLVANYKELSKNRQKISLEREKLLQHIHSSDEGVCFFTPSREVAFYNGLFIHNLNMITDYRISTPNVIFSEDIALFASLRDFLNAKDKEKNFFETEIKTQAKHFSVKLNIFEDGSFEVTLTDITQQVKTRLLKYEMTSNIAHELRTPITSIRGYLETITQSDNLTLEQTKYFANKAYNQVLNLNDLIEDMSVITKIDEAPDTFTAEQVNIKEVIEEVGTNLSDALVENKISISSNVMDNCIINGNKSLIYSIFRNLVENSIKHGGVGANIHIDCYNEDTEFYYFSYYDEGVGIEDDSHLNRIFERFYRISEGRTRKTGGTGLGLSIVKNAILVHKGTITAKRGKDGKLEFLFKLKKGKLQLNQN